MKKKSYEAQSSGLLFNRKKGIDSQILTALYRTALHCFYLLWYSVDTVCSDS